MEVMFQEYVQVRCALTTSSNVLSIICVFVVA